MYRNVRSSGQLAADITWSASKQTYYTIRFFADRNRIFDAYRAYAYFRWVDDVIDGEECLALDGWSRRALSSPEVEAAERITFAEHQQALLESCYRGEIPEDVCAEEWMLVDLVRNDTEKNSGLEIYLRNMMDVMVFDAKRRGKLISQAELSGYSHKLGKAVTEALYYFIGHDDPSPCHEARYMAVTAAHITHMLRDAMEDIGNRYYNIPREYMEARGISPNDLDGQAYREWVCGRVQLARGYFQMARSCTSQVRNLRCRLAGYAYTARFEWMLRTIERDHYCLRCDYPERKSLAAGFWMAWHTLVSMLAPPAVGAGSRKLAPQPVKVDKREIQTGL